jgi:hypothetical protein
MPIQDQIFILGLFQLCNFQEVLSEIELIFDEFYVPWAFVKAEA